jgi:hypothetical protein
MRLGYALELVAGCGVGLALARYEFRLWYWHERALGVASKPPQWANLVGGGVLTGMALVSALSLVVEVVRHRSPTIWGPGRLIWMASGALILMIGGWSGVIGAILAVQRLRNDLHLHSWGEWIGWLAGYPVESWAGSWRCLAWTPAALWLTTIVARLPRDPAPDAREWTGRAFAILILASAVFRELAGALDW